MPYENNIVVHRKLPKGKWTIESKVPCEKCKKEYEILRAKYGEAMLDICARDEYAKHLKEKCTAEFERMIEDYFKRKRKLLFEDTIIVKKHGEEVSKAKKYRAMVASTFEAMLGICEHELRAKIRELK